MAGERTDDMKNRKTDRDAMAFNMEYVKKAIRKDCTGTYPVREDVKIVIGVKIPELLREKFPWADGDAGYDPETGDVTDSVQAGPDGSRIVIGWSAVLELDRNGAVAVCYM